MSIMDGIYKRQEQKVAFAIKQRRVNKFQGKSPVKSATTHRIDQIESYLRGQIAKNKDFAEFISVADVHDKYALNDESRLAKEKLKGRFDLRVPTNIPYEMRISKYVNEPLAFHIHKNRLFFKKLDHTPKPTLTTK